MKPDEGSFVNEKLPRWGQWGIVEAPSVRCLGFLDPSGGWRDACDGHVIENVQSWTPTHVNRLRNTRTHIFGEQSRTFTTG